MKSQRGVAEVALLVYVIGAMFLLFVPNPVSSAVGVGIRPNKTVYKEKVELIKDEQGCPIATKTTVSDDDIQQRVGFWEWLISLPIFVLLLMGAGVIFPAIAIFLNALWQKGKAVTKDIVVSVDDAMKKVKDEALLKEMKTAMSSRQDRVTKKTVDKIQGK